MIRHPRRISFLWLLVLLVPGYLAADSDPQAVAVAEHVLKAMGGRDGWQQTRYLSFEFAGRRSHLWDRHTGAHRVEGTTADGDDYLVLHNLNEQGQGNGQVWVNGAAVDSADTRSELLNNAYAAWVNDTYWLLMPYKLLDPGVHMEHQGTTTVDGQECTKLALSFGEVGLTPGDRYWVYVDEASHLVTRWEYVLQDQEPNSAPTAWSWENWQRHGKVLLSDKRKKVGGDGYILSLAPLRVLESVDPQLFRVP